MRELIWVAIVVLFGYVVFQVVRALRIKPDAPVDQENAGQASVTSEVGPVSAATASVAATPPSSAQRDIFILETGDAQAPDTKGVAAGDDFQSMLEVQRMRQDIARLEAEVSAQNDRVAALEASVVALREQVESALAGQGVSPEYNEALVFARRGLDVDAIAERCGISVAEAELVRSLAQGGRRDREDT